MMTSDELRQAIQNAVAFVDSLSDAEIKDAINAGVLDRMYTKIPRKKMTLVQRCIARNDDLSKDTAAVLSALDELHYCARADEVGISYCPECGRQWPCPTYTALHKRDDI